MTPQEKAEAFGRKLQKLVAQEKAGPMVAVFRPPGGQSHQMMVFILGEPTMEWCEGSMQALATKVIEGARLGHIKEANPTPDTFNNGIIDLSKVKKN